MSRMHPRYYLVEAAKHEMTKAIIEILQRRSLTVTEEIRAVTEVLSSQVLGITKYQLREERHGDTDTPADRAPDKPCPECGGTGADANENDGVCQEYEGEGRVMPSNAQTTNLVQLLEEVFDYDKDDMGRPTDQVDASEALFKAQKHFRALSRKLKKGSRSLIHGR